MNIGKKDARHLLDVLIYLRKAGDIVRSSGFESRDVDLLALERCIEIADEAFQRLEPNFAGDFNGSLILGLSRLRRMISRDYHLVDPKALREAVLHDFPDLIRLIEPQEIELHRIAEIRKPTSFDSP